jgi:GxxExxY protein
VELERLAAEVVDSGLKVHKVLGPGLRESIYENCLVQEFRSRGIDCQRQVAVPIIYQGVQLEAAYRIDLTVGDAIIIEVKAVETLTKLHQAQTLTYLKLAKYRLGFQMNFNVVLFKHGIRRLMR